VAAKLSRLVADLDRSIFDFAGVAVARMRVGKEDIQKDAENVAEECAGRSASDQGLNRPESEAITERDCHRETCRGKHKSH
jgi:hypothetical protein